MGFFFTPKIKNFKFTENQQLNNWCRVTIWQLWLTASHVAQRGEAWVDT